MSPNIAQRFSRAVDGMRLASRSQASFEPRLVENATGDLFDGALGCVDARNVVAFEDRLGRAHFELHLRRRGIVAVRSPLVADLLQSLRRNRQSVQLALDLRQRSR